MPWQDLFLKIIIKIFGQPFVKNIKNREIFCNKVDSIDNVQGIANLFAEKYDDLYNSVSYDVDDMCTLKETIENKILCSYGDNLY